MPLNEKLATPSLSALGPWKYIINFLPGSQILRGRDGMWIQKLEDAEGDEVNLDYYPIEIYEMPILNSQRATPNEFFEYWRKHLNDFLDHTAGSVSPYSDDDSPKWMQRPATGAVMHFDMQVGGSDLDLANLEDGSVVAGEHTDRFWVFTTIYTPDDRSHPVGGNRKFGWKPGGGNSPPGIVARSTNAPGSDSPSNDNTFEAEGTYHVFYTRAADRVWGTIDSTLMSGTIFSGGHDFWIGLQRKTMNFVNANGGRADVSGYISERYNWESVRTRYYRPNGGVATSVDTEEYPGRRWECWIRRSSLATVMRKYSNGIIGEYPSHENAEAETGRGIPTGNVWERSPVWERWVRRPTTAIDIKAHAGGFIGVYNTHWEADAEKGSDQPWAKDS